MVFENPNPTIKECYTDDAFAKQNMLDAHILFEEGEELIFTPWKDYRGIEAVRFYDPMNKHTPLAMLYHRETDENPRGYFGAIDQKQLAQYIKAAANLALELMEKGQLENDDETWNVWRVITHANPLAENLRLGQYPILQEATLPQYI